MIEEWLECSCCGAPVLGIYSNVLEPICTNCEYEIEKLAQYELDGGRPHA